MIDEKTFEGIDKQKHSRLMDFMKNAFKSVDLGGKNVIQTPDGEFIEYNLMSEEYFVDNWLTQFAIGKTGVKNYFNHEQWSKYTDGFTKGIIVLDKDKVPVLLIRKFIDMDLNVNQQSWMDHYARLASNAAHMQDKSEQDELIYSFSQRVEEITEQNEEYDTLTALIPFEYFMAYGINPFVLKQIIYIRDTYTYKGEAITPDSPVLGQIETILYKNSRAEILTKEEVDLIREITEDNFIFNTGANKVDTKDQPNSSQAVDEPFDPLAD